MEITVAQEPSVKIFPGMQEDLCKLSSALAVLASSSVKIPLFNHFIISCSDFGQTARFCIWLFLTSCFVDAQFVSKERTEFLRLVNKEVSAILIYKYNLNALKMLHFFIRYLENQDSINHKLK